MLRWKSRLLPLLVCVTLIAAALANAGIFDFANWDW